MSETENTIRLLLVDDEREFLEATARALSRRGFSVRTAERGDRALELLAQEACDVVVLDVKMPGPDGIEVFERIRRHDPRLPVVMLTGHGTVQQAFTTSRDGVFDYLAKPIEIERLVQVLRRAVRERYLGAEAAPRPEDGAPIRVLMVDDELDFLHAVAPALRRRGMEVTTAPGAGEALSQIARQQFDVALVDLRMPGTDGIELLRRLTGARPLTPVILISGQPTLDKMVEAFEERAFAFLVKPQTIEALSEKIREAHAQREQRFWELQQRRVRAVLDEYPD